MKTCNAQVVLILVFIALECLSCRVLGFARHGRKQNARGLTTRRTTTKKPITTYTASYSSRSGGSFGHPLLHMSSPQQQAQQPPPADDDNKFDEEAYEKDRLEKDQKAMEAMKQESEQEFAKLRTPWKWIIRKRIWDMMEETNIAQFPRPVHHRIPNFVGAELAAKRLATLEEFQSAHCVKVNPDTPQRPVRHLVLEGGKILLTPQPRLRTGFFSTLEMATLPRTLRVEECTNSKGVVKFGTPVTLHDKYTVDLVVVGSTAVCPTTGARVGKGEGFAELEWGILSLQGNLNPESTLVVTTVHDEQVVNDIPSDSLTKHDVPVDIIVTPTRIIRVPNRVPKPSGVYWDLLSPQKLAQIRVLQELKQSIEVRDEIILPAGPDEVLPPIAARGRKGSKSNKNKNSKNGKNKRGNTTTNRGGGGDGNQARRRRPQGGKNANKRTPKKGTPKGSPKNSTDEAKTNSPTT